ncbi:MAG TPA: DegT/DnrJ/EryC1/StrS family aminotransferase [Pyrinomonadaceae bacterium]|jgi:perosamine synthetase|nr:DegT/DnrJ/EryC1/StrS family aminotransferase [Pyrinomonadaceae bacterium]
MVAELELDAAAPRGSVGDDARGRPPIPVAAPVFAGREREYVADCMESGWISSAGKYVELFESEFAKFCGARHAVSCCNGTAALHLSLAALGVGPGDEVIVPTLTFVATANAVTYCGARPVFADSEAGGWNLDPAHVASKITPRTKGVVAVHLYGNPAEMDALNALARRHGLFLLEDAAEAHGALYRGGHAGSLGDIAAFSFYGNKIISTGEGGMVTTDDDALAARVRLLRGQGMDAERRYWFPVVGYNYRMMNLPAAIGLAQLERAAWHTGRRREAAADYKRLLGGVGGLGWQAESDWSRHAYWMFTVMLGEELEDEAADFRDRLMARLQEDGVETRPVFYPVHGLPPYREASRGEEFPVAESLARRGVSLPTWAGLSPEDLGYVCERLRARLSER